MYLLVESNCCLRETTETLKTRFFSQRVFSSCFQKFMNSASKCKSPPTQALSLKPITTHYVSLSGFDQLSAFCHGQRVITSEVQMSLAQHRFKQICFSLATRNQAVLQHRRSLTSGIHIDPTNLPQIILQMPGGGL